MSDYTQRDTMADAIYQKLTGDATLVGLLGSYLGAPSVFQQETPEDSENSPGFPLIVFDLTAAAPGVETHWLKRLYTLSIAVYDYQPGSGSPDVAQQIARQLETLLDQQRITDPGIQAGRAFLESNGLVSPTEDSEKGSIHYQLVFTIHAYRQQMAEILSQ